MQKGEPPQFWFMICNARPPLGIFPYLKPTKGFTNEARRASNSAMTGAHKALVMGYLINTLILN
jgi:hypothetical protein